MLREKYALSALVFTIIFLVLALVQIKVENPILLAERFVQGGGWLEIVFVSFYGGFLALKMKNVNNSSKWRLRSWTIFSIVFFCQLVLGIIASDKFLMTGNLHIPVPAMILAGPIYRGQISIMTFLFISTLILTGPAWCSHLCYFGALDGLAAKQKPHAGKLPKKMGIKHSLFFLFILVTLLLRIFQIKPLLGTILGIAFGVGGLGMILFKSLRKGKMMQCILYCPIGTLVNYGKYINPMRMFIDTNCSFCSSCSSVCRYDALTLTDLTKKKPGKTCTYCGDCLSSCQINSIKYKFAGAGPETSRNIYLVLSISVHVIFLALARI